MVSLAFSPPMTTDANHLVRSPNKVKSHKAGSRWSCTPRRPTATGRRRPRRALSGQPRQLLSGPQLPVPAGANIDTWVREQRKAASRGLLNDQRRRRLESLPEWAWNRRDLACVSQITRVLFGSDVMSSAAAALSLSDGERETLERLARAQSLPPRQVVRAQVLLLAADGWPTR